MGSVGRRRSFKTGVIGMLEFFVLLAALCLLGVRNTFAIVGGAIVLGFIGLVLYAHFLA
ncbi:hypothetical protein VPHD479_0151 [Vibrio phage D479]